MWVLFCFVFPVGGRDRGRTPQPGLEQLEDGRRFVPVDSHGRKKSDDLLQSVIEEGTG